MNYQHKYLYVQVLTAILNSFLLNCKLCKVRKYFDSYKLSKHRINDIA